MSAEHVLNPIPSDLLPRLDPCFVEYYNKNAANSPATHQIPLEEVRANPRRWARSWAVDAKDSAETRIRDSTVAALSDGDINDSFKVRTYHPNEAIWGPGPYAAHVNFHGGGWVFGDLTSDAAICLRLRDRLPIVVVDVDYRLCPEAQFGHNAEDAWKALLWTRDNSSTLNIDPASISIGGISAGAHLACILQHRARDEKLSLKLFIATVPPVADHDQYTQASDSPWPSYSEFSHIPTLGWDRMNFFRKHVFPPETLSAILETYPPWWISPLRAPDFTGLCDTFVATAECDVLRDEGEAYGKKLLEAGNKVTFRRYLKVPHVFMHMVEILPQAREYEEDIIRALQVAHDMRKN